jgi:hypothetical protein
MSIFRRARRIRTLAEQTALAALAAEALGGSGYSGDSPAAMMRLTNVDRAGRGMVAVTDLPGNITPVFVPAAGATVHHIDRRTRQSPQPQRSGRRNQPVRPPATAATATGATAATATGAPVAKKLNLPAPPRATLAWLDKSA